MGVRVASRWYGHCRRLRERLCDGEDEENIGEEHRGPFSDRGGGIVVAVSRQWLVPGDCGV